MKSRIVPLFKLNEQDIVNMKAIERSFIKLVGEIKYEKITLSVLSRSTGLDQKTIISYYPTKKSLLKEIEQKILNDISHIIIKEKIIIPDAINELKKREPKKRLSQFLSTYHSFFQTAINPSLFFNFQRKFCAHIESLLMDKHSCSIFLSEQHKKVFSHYNTYAFFGLLTALNEQLNKT